MSRGFEGRGPGQSSSSSQLSRGPCERREPVDPKVLHGLSYHVPSHALGPFLCHPSSDEPSARCTLHTRPPTPGQETPLSHFNSSRRSPRGCPVEASSFAHGDRRSQVRQSASGLRCMSSNEPHCCSNGSFVGDRNRYCLEKRDSLQDKDLQPAQKEALENVQARLSMVRSIASSLLSQKSPRPDRCERTSPRSRPLGAAHAKPRCRRS